MGDSRRGYLLRQIENFRSDPMVVDSFCFRIAGVGIRLRTSSEKVRRYCEFFFLGFHACGTIDLELTVEPYGPTAGFPDLWEDPDPEFDLRGDAVVQRDFVARRLPFREAEPEQPDRVVAWLAPEVEDAVHNLLRWALIPRLLRSHAFLVHAAGIVRNGVGYLFFGQSGAGKSTVTGFIAKSDPHAIVLGDDGVIIEFAEGQALPSIHAAPLGSGYSRVAPPPLSAPLGGLFALSQDEAHRVVPLAPAEGAAALLASAMCVDASADLDLRMDLSVRFAFSKCGIHRLQFRRDPGFWPLILEGKTDDHDRTKTKEKQAAREI